MRFNNTISKHKFWFCFCFDIILVIFFRYQVNFRWCNEQNTKCIYLSQKIEVFIFCVCINFDFQLKCARYLFFCYTGWSLISTHIQADVKSVHKKAQAFRLGSQKSIHVASVVGTHCVITHGWFRYAWNSFDVRMHLHVK